jgi:Skp family chaperone for outer membrane proteins
MKKMMMTMLLVIVAITAGAQEKKNENFAERMFEAKVREMTYRLELTDAQKEKFVPIYRQYNNEMRAAWGERRKPGKPANEQESLAATKAKMERQQRAQAVRIKYVDEFAKVLNARQLSKFLFTEKQIQNKLNKRKHERHGDRGGKGGFDDRGHKGHKGPLLPGDPGGSGSF